MAASSQPNVGSVQRALVLHDHEVVVDLIRLTLNHGMFVVRIKLQNDYRHPRFIETVPGHGYRFIPTFSDAGWVVPSSRGRSAH